METRFLRSISPSNVLQPTELQYLIAREKWYLDTPTA